MKSYTTTILILFLLLVTAILGNIIISTIGIFFNHDVIYTGIYSNHDVSLSSKLIFVLKALALLMFVYGVYVLIRKLKFLVKRDFFNYNLIHGFLQSGKLFLISGLIGFFASIAGILNLVVIKDFGSQTYLNIDSKSLYIMLMILGLFLILFPKVLNKGIEIQQENDLTI